jgi:hypothetical protein
MSFNYLEVRKFKPSVWFLTQSLYVGNKNCAMCQTFPHNIEENSWVLKTEELYNLSVEICGLMKGKFQIKARQQSNWFFCSTYKKMAPGANIINYRLFAVIYGTQLARE